MTDYDVLYRLLRWIDEFQVRNKLPDSELLTLQDLKDIVRDAMNDTWS